MDVADSEDEGMEAKIVNALDVECVWDVPASSNLHRRRESTQV
jgi:hypothetical protein